MRRHATSSNYTKVLATIPGLTRPPHGPRWASMEAPPDRSVDRRGSYVPLGVQTPTKPSQYYRIRRNMPPETEISSWSDDDATSEWGCGLRDSWMSWMESLTEKFRCCLHLRLSDAWEEDREHRRRIRKARLKKCECVEPYGRCEVT